MTNARPFIAVFTKGSRLLRSGLFSFSFRVSFSILFCLSFSFLFLLVKMLICKVEMYPGSCFWNGRFYKKKKHFNFSSLNMDLVSVHFYHWPFWINLQLCPLANKRRHNSYECKGLLYRCQRFQSSLWIDFCWTNLNINIYTHFKNESQSMSFLWIIIDPLFA